MKEIENLIQNHKEGLRSQCLRLKQICYRLIARKSLEEEVLISSRTEMQ